MVEIALWITSFVAAACAVSAAIKAFFGLLDRQPDLGSDAPSSATTIAAWPQRSWNLAIGLAARQATTRQGTLYRRLERDLIRSDAPPGQTPEVFLGRALVEGAALALISGLVALALFGGVFVFLALGAGVFHALVLRPQLLRSSADERVSLIHRRLPYAIDLMILVLGAGGTLREGLSLVAEKTDRDPLADEVARALARIRAGTPQSAALREMADRVGLEDLGTLVIALNRGEETGAPLAKTLTTQAEIFRFRRLQRAERLAVEAPVKMMFPNLIIMLAVLLIVIGPVLLGFAAGRLF